MSVVSIRNLSVSYGELKALDQVNLEIVEGDFIGIIGPNGGGKSTLVKAIMGMLPYSGEIFYGNGVRRGNHLSIGYLPQQEKFDNAFPISISEMVLSGLQSLKGISGRYTKADRRRAKELMDMAGIAHVASKAIAEVSGGQMQRAMLCRAFISDPKLLILDEPANFVDNKFEKELYGILKELNSKMAIVMVSHDLGTISSVVKSIVCVNKYVHRHNSNKITAEQLKNYDCPIQLVYHGRVPHTVLESH